MAETDWTKLVTDENGKRVFEGLADSRWEWRTISGLSTSSGLERDTIRRILLQHSPLIQRSSVSSTSGDELFTLKSRFFERKHPLEKAWDFLSSSSSSSRSF